MFHAYTPWKHQKNKGYKYNFVGCKRNLKYKRKTWTWLEICSVQLSVFNYFSTHFPTNIYLFKVNNRNSRKRYEIYSKLTIKTTERRYWRRSGVLINFEHISHVSSVFIVDFEQVNVSWVGAGKKLLQILWFWHWKI